MTFNKIRYWKKQLYLADIIYHSTIDTNNGIFERAYNICGEIGDYLYNLL